MSTETLAGGALAKTLSIQFMFARSAFQANIQDVSPEDSLKQPKDAGNCANWIAGHLLSSRNGALSLLGAPRVNSAEQMARYQRGSEAVKDGAGAMAWGDILAGLEETQEKILAALGQVTAEQLATPLPEDANPFQLDNVGEMLSAISFHESYHVGQLGLLRRVLGMAPAIA